MTAMTYHPHSEQREQRLLGICIAGSMLLHALVVWQGHGVPPAPPLVQQIKATIRPATPPAPPPVAAAPEPRRPEPPKEAPPPKPEVRPEPRPVQKPVVPETPKNRMVDSRPEAVAPAIAAPQAVPAVPAPPAVAAESKPDAPKVASAPSVAPASPASVDETVLVSAYQQQLAIAANNYKRYPSVAMEQYWQGTALVQVRIGTNGKTMSVEVLNSSGHDILDEQAKIAIGKAKPRVELPTGLRGKEFVAQVRVVFDLKK